MTIRITTTATAHGLNNHGLRNLMDKIIIEGGNRLVGEVTAGGAKNAVLPLMAAALLVDGWMTITNVPKLRDIETFKILLNHLGSDIESDPENSSLKIRTRDVSSPEAPYELVKTMRASVLVLGPLVARFKRARVSLPGGCAIGARPIDLHLKGLKAMGAEVVIEHGYVTVTAEKLKGAKIYMDTVTVTGTENLMLAAVHAEGTTILENCALEPEVVCLANALGSMGARITGAGTDTIKIHGVEKLNAVEIRVIPDRIEAGTFMVAAAMTRGNVLIKDCPYHNLDALNMKLKEAGTEVIAEEGGVLKRDGHTEAVIDLLKLASLKEIGVLCEILNEEGNAAARGELELFAKSYGFSILSIKDLIAFRREHE